MKPSLKTWAIASPFLIGLSAIIADLDPIDTPLVLLMLATSFWAWHNLNLSGYVDDDDG
jgi:hypothetical protein